MITIREFVNENKQIYSAKMSDKNSGHTFEIKSDGSSYRYVRGVKKEKYDLDRFKFYLSNSIQNKIEGTKELNDYMLKIIKKTYNSKDDFINSINKMLSQSNEKFK